MAVKLNDLTDKERMDLMRQLEAEEKAKRNQLRKKRKDYESNREKRIKKAFRSVEKAEKMLFQFKTDISDMMAEQHAELDEFGKIPTNSKGGFSIESKDGQYKITRTRDTDPKWDETAVKGASLIKEFLVEQGQAQVDPSIYELLMGLLEKNNQGDLEFSKIMLFLKHQDTFKDPKWLEGLRLLREGYHVEFKKFGYQFFRKDKDGKFRSISINFSSL